MILPRRRLFGIGAAFLAAPAIVRASALMPVSVAEEPYAIWNRLESPGWLRLDAVRAFVGQLQESPDQHVVLAHQSWFETFHGEANA